MGMNGELEQDEGIDIGGTRFVVMGSTTVYRASGPERVILAQHRSSPTAQPTYLTATLKDGVVIDAPLSGLGLSGVLDGYAVRCGAPLRLIHPA
jgi:hypothetical protein